MEKTVPRKVDPDSHWFFPRDWGWVTSPLTLGGTMIGDRGVRLFLPRPDLNDHDRQTVGRYLGWRFGIGRVALWLLLAVATLLLVGGPVPWLWVVAAGALAGFLIDAAVIRILRRRASTGLDSTRTARSVVRQGKRRLFGNDTPPFIGTPEVLIVSDLLDQISALRRDRLLEDREWVEACWWCWDVLEASPTTRTAVGWRSLIGRLEALLDRAATRAA